MRIGEKIQGFSLFRGRYTTNKRNRIQQIPLTLSLQISQVPLVPGVQHPEGVDRARAHGEHLARRARALAVHVVELGTLGRK